MRAKLFCRRPLPGQISIERVFDALLGHLDAEPLVMPRESRGLVNRLANLLFARRNRADVNHIAGDVNYIALGLPRKGLVLSVHDLYGLSRLSGPRRAVLKLFWYTLPVARASVVTTVSDALREELEREIPASRGKTRTVPNPVAPLYAPAPKPWPEPSARGRFRVLMVGAYSAKNVPRQIEALQGLNADLALAGRPEPEAAALVEAYGGTMLGELGPEEMARAYQECDLVLFASIYEGYGLPIVEAQATGRPVITSDRGAMREVSGGAAILVDPESVPSIRAAVIALATDPALRARLVTAGYENARRYTVESVAAAYREAYRDACRDSVT